MLTLLLAACATTTAAPLPSTTVPKGFWDHWGDGKAELDGYKLTQPRYGEARDGHTVWIFVTEDFTKGDRVKSDGGHGDEYPVMKWNEARDFTTGIYDYHLMTSTFAALDGRDPAGIPTKISFSSQEWCGLLHDQLVTDGGRYERQTHSYFDGEADSTSELAIPEGAVFVDMMPLLVRGALGEVVAPGKSVDVKVHPRLQQLRLLHQDASFVDGVLSRGKIAETTVPAGSFRAEPWTLTAGSSEWVYWVETARPHRIIAFEGPMGERGELTGTVRTDYWSRNRTSDGALRAKLGL